MRMLDNGGGWLAEYRRDVEIACAELSRIFPELSAKTSTLFTDVYSLPAHNHQTFLCRATCEGGFMRIYYAKAVQNSIWFSEPIFMYRFEEARQFADHPIRHGRIICGKKLIRRTVVDRFMSLVNAVSENRPAETVAPSLDSELTVIRLFENGEVKREIMFTDAERLVFREGEDAESAARQLNGLCAFIERMIGS